ncbi:MAG: hypothetical protein K1X88_04970 [Nannocystaceae bacterium]|nr:hypothetical protein [Nannocystaceae bacterium]
MRAPVLALATLVAALAGCDADASADEDDDSSDGGKADDLDPTTFGCKQVTGIALADLAAIDDPIATFLIKRAPRCASDYGELVAQLAQVDADGCAGKPQLTTRLVSDDARVDPKPDNYRTVTTRACGSRPPHALLWTLLGVNDREDMAKRSFVEMQALDRNSGLYDYWVFQGGAFEFVGNSLQARDQAIRCGACHRDGGVLMKELDDPWLHWEAAARPLPGADAIFARHGALMGNRGDGKELETLVRAGNDAIIASRIAADRRPEARAVRKLLRPLFCSEQVNLDAGGTQVDAPLSGLDADALVDPSLGVTQVLTLDPAAYTAALATVGQRLDGVPDRVDTEFAFAFPERSGFEHAYLAALQREGLVDEDLLLDVLTIDFTRPLFSDARCGLLQFVPESLPQIDAASIRAGLDAALAASAPATGSAAASLREHLADTADAPAHRERVRSFLAACNARDDQPFLEDLLRYTSLTRDLVRSTTSLIEHAEQLPRASVQVASAAHLDPATCTLAQ